MVTGGLYYKKKGFPGVCGSYRHGGAPVHTFGRIGCFLEVLLRHSCDLALSIPRTPSPWLTACAFPVQLLEALFCFCLFLLLFSLFRRGRCKNRLLASLPGIYSVGRFFLEYLRGGRLPGLPVGPVHLPAHQHPAAERRFYLVAPGIRNPLRKVLWLSPLPGFLRGAACSSAKPAKRRYGRRRGFPSTSLLIGLPTASPLPRHWRRFGSCISEWSLRVAAKAALQLPLTSSARFRHWRRFGPLASTEPQAPPPRRLPSTSLLTGFRSPLPATGAAGSPQFPTVVARRRQGGFPSTPLLNWASGLASSATGGARLPQFSQWSLRVAAKAAFPTPLLISFRSASSATGGARLREI